ncbi:MAG: hypothetical protein WCF94_02460 [bacterium]
MWKFYTIFISGILVVIMPFSGLPMQTKNTLFVICGLLIVSLAYLWRRESLVLHHTIMSDNAVVTEMYVENMTKKSEPEIVPETTEETK